LKHIELLLERDPQLFSEDYKQFFIIHQDPDYLKELKIKLLGKIVTNWNVSAVVEELGDSVLETSQEISGYLLSTIAKITIRFPGVVEQTFSHLLSLIDLQLDWLTSSCMVAIAGMLQSFFFKVVNSIHKNSV
jgi:hypothetical protein